MAKWAEQRGTAYTMLKRLSFISQQWTFNSRLSNKLMHRALSGKFKVCHLSLIYTLVSDK